jgi:hypothetical protein
VALDRDRIRSLQVRPDLGSLLLRLETSDPGAHRTLLHLSAPAGTYRLRGPQGLDRNLSLENGKETAVEIPMEPGPGNTLALDRLP